MKTLVAFLLLCTSILISAEECPQDVRRLATFDPARIVVREWRGIERPPYREAFVGTIDELVQREDVWPNFFYGVGELKAKDSKSSQFNQNAQTPDDYRRILWPWNGRDQDPPSYEISRDLRFAVDVINGKPRTLQVWAYANDRWHPLLYERVGDKWERRHRTEEGDTLVLACARCHRSARGDLGPAIKTPGYKPALGWNLSVAESGLLHGDHGPRDAVTVQTSKSLLLFPVSQQIESIRRGNAAARRAEQLQVNAPSATPTKP